MKPVIMSVLLWIQSNPGAVKSYMVALLALVAKGIMAATGKSADLGQWQAFTDQAIDLFVGALTIWGVIAGSIHVSRGSSPTSVNQAAAIVSVLEPTTAAVAVDQIKTTAAAIVAAEPPAPQPGSHKF